MEQPKECNCKEGGECKCVECKCGDCNKCNCGGMFKKAYV